MAELCHRRAWSFVVYVFVWVHISQGEGCRNAVGMRRAPPPLPHSRHGFGFTSLTWCPGPFDSLLHATSRCPSWQPDVYRIKKPHVPGPPGHNHQWKRWALSKMSCQSESAGTKSFARFDLESIHREERWIIWIIFTCGLSLCSN